MGFFTNTGALKEGEIVLSCDHRHLYRIMEGKFVEFKKRLTSIIPNFGKPGQEPGDSVYDSTKRVMYVYNIDTDIWDVLDLVQLQKGDADSYTLNIL